jgi:hypothetical protein
VHRDVRPPPDRPRVARAGLSLTMALVSLAAASGAPGLSAAPGNGPEYRPAVVPVLLEQDFTRKNFRRDPRTGNYLSPKVSTKTLNEIVVPVSIDGKYQKDLRGNPIFLRETIARKLAAADAAMFAKKHEHIKVNYGFRSNLLQYELYQQLNGHAKVAPPGMSFHETGMALDVSNWRDAQRFMIEAGFVGGCYGIEEDLVHYSVNEITKASNAAAFKRCTLKEIPENILKGLKKTGEVLKFRRKKST